MYIGPTFVSCHQLPEAVEPGEGSLDYREMAAEPLTVFYAPPCDTHRGVMPVTGATTTSLIVGLIGCSFCGQQRGRPRCPCTGDTPSSKDAKGTLSFKLASDSRTTSGVPRAIGQQVSLGAGAAPVGRVGTYRRSPFWPPG